MARGLELDDLLNLTIVTLRNKVPIDPETGQRPFWSGYEIGLLIYRGKPEYYDSIGYGIGGQGTGKPYSLASKINGLWSKLPAGDYEIKEITKDEVMDHLRDLLLPNEDPIIPSQWKITAFRYRW